MRDIKFRAWDECKKVMHHDFKFMSSGPEPNDWIVFRSDQQPFKSNPNPFDNPYCKQQFKIMQYTGLKDKNGKEIYEGDILKSGYKVDISNINTVIDTHYIDVIYYDSGCFWLTSNDDDCYDECFSDIKGENLEVIGNIYENPELIKGR